MTVRVKQRLLTGASLALALMALTACGRHSIPQDTLNPAGPVAAKQASLYWLVFWIAVVVFVLVEGLLIFIVVRYRHRPGRSVPKQIHGNTVFELGWTIAPAVLLGIIAFPTIGTIFDLAHRPTGANVVEITVTGHQWWWQADYPKYHVTTANEIHIPAGQPVYVTLKSVDVIHSFWVPRLAGKQDLEPGRVNHLTIEADRPGEYLGQCAEFCGASHANMRLRVFADSPADFQTWLTDQARPAAPPPPDTLQIMQGAGCGGCHTLNGVEGFVGVIGPNLSHFGSRTTFAGSTFANNPTNLAAWLRDPPAVKPGADMPNLHLTPDQIRALIAYLESAK